MKWLSACFLLAALLLLSGLQPTIADDSGGATAEEPSGDQVFVRLKRDESGKPESLQVAVVRYVPRDKNQHLEYVDLISAVHIGEHEYYSLINFLFTRYDAVLYELVAAQGTRVPRGGNEKKGIISGAQSWMRDVLDMGMQLEDVDYTLPHLVHADLSPREFSERMDERNESVFGMIGKATLAGMGKRNTARILLSEMRLLRNLMSGNRDLALKIFMAEQMVQSIKLGDAIEGREGSTLVAERNKKALQVLRQEIDAGKKKLAIFYGAAHMPDMSKRLQSEFDLAPASTVWLDAWKLK
ncbi:MAG TPA: hypothetical protein EYP34_02245 [Chromatiaceae bacterium]|nr:hypothetical protein [Chromatiaceae bacterium]